VVVALSATLVLAVALPNRFARLLHTGHGAGPVPVEVVAQRDFVQWVPAEGNLKAVRSTALNVPMAEVENFHIAWIAEDGSRVHQGDVVVRFDATDLEKTLTDAESDLASARLKTAKQHASDASDISKLELDVALAGVELTNARDFQKKDRLLFSRHDIIQSGIDQELAVAREHHAGLQRSNRAMLGKADLDLLAVDLRKADDKLRRARSGLAALNLVAPHDGVLILTRSPWNRETPHVGDTVWQGMQLAEIPDLSTMQAEVYVLEADAGGLAAGKSATVAVESDPGVSYPARVRRVDTIAKPRLRGSPVQYFAVTLALARTDPRVMKPGQRVQATLRLEERRAALVVPRQALFQRDGRTVVYRQTTGGGFAPTLVERGPSDAAVTVITAGLNRGDAVALLDPTALTVPTQQPSHPTAAPRGAALPGIG
jgi:HlyD family secretion protein